jgi:hypothetical protein
MLPTKASNKYYSYKKSLEKKTRCNETNEIQGTSYQASHEEQDRAAEDRDSHILIIPAEPFSLRELYHKENLNKNLN